MSDEILVYACVANVFSSRAGGSWAAASGSANPSCSVSIYYRPSIRKGRIVAMTSDTLQVVANVEISSLINYRELGANSKFYSFEWDGLVFGLQFYNEETTQMFSSKIGSVIKKDIEIPSLAAETTSQVKEENHCVNESSPSLATLKTQENQQKEKNMSESTPTDKSVENDYLPVDDSKKPARPSFSKPARYERDESSDESDSDWSVQDGKRHLIGLEKKPDLSTQNRDDAIGSKLHVSSEHHVDEKSNVPLEPKDSSKPNPSMEKTTDQQPLSSNKSLSKGDFSSKSQVTEASISERETTKPSIEISKKGLLEPFDVQKESFVSISDRVVETSHVSPIHKETAGRFVDSEKSVRFLGEDGKRSATSKMSSGQQIFDSEIAVDLEDSMYVGEEPRKNVLVSEDASSLSMSRPNMSAGLLDSNRHRDMEYQSKLLQKDQEVFALKSRVLHLQDQVARVSREARIAWEEKQLAEVDYINQMKIRDVEVRKIELESSAQVKRAALEKASCVLELENMRSQLRALSDTYTECEGELTRWKGEVVRLALQLMTRERDTSHDSIKHRESIMNAESARAMAERRAVDSDSRRIQAESRCTALEEELLTLRRQTQSSFISLQIEKSNYSRQIAETRSELELYRMLIERPPFESISSLVPSQRVSSITGEWIGVLHAKNRQIQRLNQEIFRLRSDIARASVDRVLDIAYQSRNTELESGSCIQSPSVKDLSEFGEELLAGLPSLGHPSENAILTKSVTPEKQLGSSDGISSHFNASSISSSSSTKRKDSDENSISLLSDSTTLIMIAMDTLRELRLNESQKKEKVSIPVWDGLESEASERNLHVEHSEDNPHLYHGRDDKSGVSKSQASILSPRTHSSSSYAFFDVINSL